MKLLNCLFVVCFLLQQISSSISDMSHNERQICLHDSQPVARLKDDKRRQIIRLVNPLDTKIGFIVDTSPSESSLTIAPKSGFILPRNYTLIFIDNPDYMRPSPNGIKKLNLIYLVRDPFRRRGYSKRMVPIDIAGKEAYDTLHDRGEGNTFIWLVMRSLRSILLITLIFYNIILIKLCLDK